jgi:hypothetical protein
MTQPAYDKVLALGHNLEFQAVVPKGLIEPQREKTPWMLVPQHIGTVRVQDLLTKAFDIRAPVLAPHENDTDYDRGGELTHWRLVEAKGKAGPQQELRTVAVRIGDTEEIHFEKKEITARPRVTYYRPKRGFKATKRTAVHIFLEANCPYPSKPFDGQAGLVVVHLSSSGYLRAAPAGWDPKQQSNWDPKDPKTLPNRGHLCAWLEGSKTWAAKLVVVTNSRFLNFVEVPLTEDRSWEGFANECVVELEALLPNGGIVHHLVGGPAAADPPVLLIRHTANSVVQIERAKHDRSKLSARLHYLVDAKHTLPAGPGFLVGANSILSVALFGKLVTGGTQPLDKGVEEGVADGLLRTTLFAKRGYLGTTADADEKPYFDSDWAAALFRESAAEQGRICCITDCPRGRDRPDWSILGQWIGSAPDPEARAFGIGTLIVKEGLAEATKKHNFPVVAFGQLQITERRMFEDYWEIRASIQKYLQDLSRERRPLSLAVFGAPGGGKSFGIKELAKSLNNPYLELPPIEANVSQFNSVADLARELRKVRDVSLSGKAPLVFFDEFDAFWNRRPFGWLQYFLAPMQDGEFGVGDQKIKFPHAIFVFVGGLNHTFEMFNGRLRNRGFIEAKGPDFVSRLAKHLDILGIDEERDGDFTYMIRRAAIIRQKIEESLPKVIEGKRAKVEEDVIRAFLRVPRFKHGVRSLEAIIRTSRVAHDQPFLHWGTLPQTDQLEMHVSVQDFQKARRGLNGQ